MIETKKRPDAVAAAAGHISNTSSLHSSPIERILSRLDKVRDNGNGRFLARCPAHEDKTPSLSVRECSDGTVLVKCWAGCSSVEIVRAVSLELKDLFPPKPFTGTRPRDGLTSQQRREYKALLNDEAYLVKFAQATLASGGHITPEDAERALLADERVRKLRGILNV